MVRMYELSEYLCCQTLGFLEAGTAFCIFCPFFDKHEWQNESTHKREVELQTASLPVAG